MDSFRHHGPSPRPGRAVWGSAILKSQRSCLRETQKPTEQMLRGSRDQTRQCRALCKKAHVFLREPAMRPTTARIKNPTKRIFAIPAAPEAIPPNPKTAAMMARTKNPSAQRSMMCFLCRLCRRLSRAGVRGRAGPPRFVCKNTLQPSCQRFGGRIQAKIAKVRHPSGSIRR